MRILLVLITVYLFSCTNVDKTRKHTVKLDFSDERGYFRIMFYNVENYFDPFNDSLKNDEEFTPEGSRYWTWTKYKDKQKKIYKVITAVGGWELPEIIGLCEIENRFVLNDLINSTPLKWKSYDIVHRESPDNRGIDVAMLYRSDKFTIISSDFIKIIYPPDTNKKTRDILYAKGATKQNDTLHIFVNHWPSRLGGQAESEVYRINAASILRTKIDSIFKAQAHSNIIILGDFNDEPDNHSITKTLGAKNTYDSIIPSRIYNLAWYMKHKNNMGSLKYQGEWGLIDQIIVSSQLLSSSNSIFTTINHIKVFNPDFLSEQDEGFIGVKPFRTFVGFRYNGGFSDHYPVYLDLFKTK